MNKKTTLLILLFALSLIEAFGQGKGELQQHSDSLYRQLLVMKDSEQKAKALFDLSFFWSDYDSAKALKYIEQAEKVLGAKGSASYYRGLASFYRAAAYFDTDASKAKQYYLQAEDQLKQTDQRHHKAALSYRARLWGSYGALLQRDGKPQAYVNILLHKVIPMATQLKDSTLLGNNYQNVAMALMNLKAYGQAEKYYADALHLLEGRKNAEEQLFTLTVNAARNSFFRNDAVKTKQFLDKAEHLAKQLRSSSYLPIYHTVAGSYWAKHRDRSKSDLHFSIALDVAKKQQNEDMTATILYDQSTALQAAGQYQEAMDKLLAVLPYVRRNKSLANKQMVYYDLATTAVKLGQYQRAAQWYEAHKKLSDTIFTDKGREQIVELEKRYQTTAKEKELLKVRAQSQQQQLSLQKTRMWVGILILTTVILSLLASTWYAALKHRKKLAAQKEMLLQEESKNRQQQEKLGLYNAMLQGQEKERSRIARDLHDGLGGVLASTKLKLSSVAANMVHKRQTETLTDLHAIIDQLDHSVDELRRIARNMMPESLLSMGLENALRDLCRSMSHVGLQIDFHASNLNKYYTQHFLIAVYRIMQELLTNAIKHSSATQVWVQCSEADEKFHINVEDNGKGFDLQDRLSKSAGIGFANIQNRVDILNGQFEIDAAVGKGASFHIQLDLHE